MAAQQFDAVNPNLDRPNVLIFVNHDEQCGPADLRSVLTGEFICEDGHGERLYSEYSDGRIKEENLGIHLYLWLQPGKRPLFRFSCTEGQHFESLCRSFQVEASGVKHW